MEKNDIVTLTITDLDASGAGVGRADGIPVFVSNAVIGDTISARLTKIKKNMAYGHLEEILQPSADRVTPVCPDARVCGGCQLQAMSYEAQLKFKENRVRAALLRIGGFDEAKVDACMRPVIGMEEPLRYRNKTQVPFGRDKEGRIVCGFYAQRSHRIIPRTDCAIGMEEQDAVLSIVLRHMEEHGIDPYDELTGKGLIRHVLLRKGFATGEIMVCLVVNHAPVKRLDHAKKVLPGAMELTDALRAVPGVASICLNFNDKNTNVILGEVSQTIYGTDRIVDRMDDLTFGISPTSFYQVNPVQTKKLYRCAVEAANLTGKETVYDLYCGVGTISLMMAKGGAKEVIGIEISKEAISDARKNATYSGIRNVTFRAGKAEELCDGKADVIVVDPPRKGCDKALLNTILREKPSRIVYVSCDPATLARDLKVLAEGGYGMVSVQPVDCFCQTVHVETVCLLSNTQSKKKESYITLDVEMEDYYRIKNEGKNSTT